MIKLDMDMGGELLIMRWTITLITAVTMAVINFFTIWIISFAVEWKFNTLQAPRGLKVCKMRVPSRPSVDAQHAVWIVSCMSDAVGLVSNR